MSQDALEGSLEGHEMSVWNLSSFSGDRCGHLASLWELVQSPGRSRKETEIASARAKRALHPGVYVCIHMLIYK